MGPLAEPSPFAFPPTAPMLARFSASFSRNLSLLLMYISPRRFRAPIPPQLSYDFCFRRLCPSGSGDNGSWLRSTLSLPILSAPDVSDPLLDGLDGPPLLRRERRLIRPVESLPPGLLGSLGAVRDEKPLGGFDVRTTGGQAASSSRATSSSCNSLSDG